MVEIEVLEAGDLAQVSPQAKPAAPKKMILKNPKRQLLIEIVCKENEI